MRPDRKLSNEPVDCPGWVKVGVRLKIDMKTRNSFGVATLLVGLCILRANVAVAQTTQQISVAKDILAKVPASDLSAKAAQLVADAPAKGKAAVAAAVAQAVVSINSDVTLAAVAAIALKAPAVAPAAAAAAASKLPDSAGAIAAAAARVPGVKADDVRSAVIAAVPAQAEQIVSAMSRAKLSSSLGLTPAAPTVARSDASIVSENRGVL